MHNNRIDPVYHQDMFEFYYVAYNNKNKKLFKSLIKKTILRKNMSNHILIYNANEL